MITLADRILPQFTPSYSRTRDVALIIAGSVLVALCAKIQIPMWPAPITLQPFAVLLVGATLGANRGALALIAYLLEGAFGLPVFAGPLAGAAYFAGPTAGYLIGFPVAAYIIGRLCEQGWDRRFWTAAAAMGIGQLIILGFGYAWLTRFVGPQRAFVDGVALFVFGDVIKTIAAAALLPSAWKLVNSGK